MSTTGRAGVSAPRPRPRYTKGERTKVRIVDAAVELYSRSGFNAVSLRDIAAQAGLTHAGLLHHFPGGREALLLEVLARRDAIDAESLDDPELSARDHLDRLLRVVRRNAGTPGLVAMYAKVSNEATSPDHPAHEYFTQRYRVLREYLGDDVLTTSGSAVVWWLARHLEDDQAVPAAVRLINELSTLSVVAQGHGHPDRADSSLMVPPLTPVGSNGDGVSSQDPAVATRALLERLFPDSEDERMMFARSLASLAERSGRGDYAVRVRTLFGVPDLDAGRPESAGEEPQDD
jgi:AcrR family transcriptional regulator